MDQSLKAPITITEALSRSWTVVTSNLGAFTGFSMLYFLAAYIIGEIPGLSLVESFLGFIYPVSLFAGFRAAETDGSVTFSNFFEWTPLFGRLLGGYIIIGLITVCIILPAFLLLIPVVGGIDAFAEIVDGYGQLSLPLVFGLAGVVLLLAIPILMLQFAFLFLLACEDKTTGEAISLSWRIGVANLGSLMLFALLSLGIAVAGALCLLVGLLVAFPLIMGMQYQFLRSIFPLEKEEEWDFMREHPPLS